MKQLFHSHVSSHLSERAEQFLRDECAHSQVLIIAPTRGAADDLVRRAANPGLAGAHRITPGILAAQLAATSFPTGTKPASRLALEALTARVLEITRREEGIPYFEAVAGTPGLARAIASTLQEIRLERVAAAELAATGDPGHDLAAISRIFDEQLDSLCDLPAILEAAVGASHQTDHFLLGLPIIWLCASIPSSLHELLARSVLKYAPKVLALMPTGDEDGIQRLSRILAVAPEALPSAGHIASALFELTPPPVVLQTDLFSAAGEGLECVEIARRIHDLARSGKPFDQIAVLLRSTERYQPLLEEAFRRAGIPAYFSRGAARPDPAGRAFLSLLACALENTSATRFAEYLSLGQVPAAPRTTPPQPLPPDDEILAAFSGQAVAPALELEPDPNAEPETAHVAAPFAWERLIVDAAVIGGRRRWQRRLNGLEAELRFQIAALHREEDDRVPRLERQLEQLRSLEAFALPLIDQLDSLPKRAKWREWLDTLGALAGAALSRPESVISVLEELRAMDEVGPVELSEVYRVLSERLRFLRREPLHSRFGRVWVANIDEVRGRSFDIVFLPGLAEGLFPRRAAEDPILLDIHRAKLTAKMKLQEDRVSAERLLLFLAAGSARERFIFSYPRMDSTQNRPRVPSFYALELLRAARGKLPDLRAFEREAASLAPTRMDWPAPHLPAQAIDDAEFDLAVMRDAIALGPAAKGAAHYLLDANAALVRSLRARGRRWRQPWYSVDGLIDPEANIKTALEKHSPTQRSYSPTALQHYAACPYRFALYAIHRLQPREEPASLEQLDPLTRGEIFHQVQFRILGEFQQQQLLPVTPANLPQAIQLANRTLDSVAADYYEELAPAIHRVWDQDIEDMRMDLLLWLQDVVSNGGPWTPSNFELAFGLRDDNPHDPASTSQDVTLNSGYRVRGSIDLVETNQAGTARVTDHKTGAVPNPVPRYIGGGAILQPVLYAAATEKLLNRTVASGRLYYCTRRGKFQQIEIPYDATARDRLDQVLETIDKAISDCFLPAAPAEGACEYCDFRLVCGPYEQIRVRRKQKSKLDSLVQLRSLS